MLLNIPHMKCTSAACNGLVREPQEDSPVSIDSVHQPDSAGNPTIEDTDILAWAQALCDARTEIERAFSHEEYASIAFHGALNHHFEHCATLGDVDQSEMAFRGMFANWQHRQDIDDTILSEFAKRARRRILRAMPYAEYLQTDHWKIVRADALVRAGERCQLCNSKTKLNVHHRTYTNRGNEQPGDLIVLCNDCHTTFHENGRLAS